MRHPLAEMAEKMALPTEETFKKQFGASSDSIAASSAHSTVFLKKLLAVGISNVAYLRGIMSDESFSDRFMGDLQLKIIRTGKGSDPVAKKMIESVKGCFDAIERKYLENVTLWFHEEADKPEIVKESYVFSFQYFDDKDSVSMSLSHNDKPVSASRTGLDVKEATVAFLKSLILVVEPLEPFTGRIYMQMRLSYRHDFAPADYQPPGFVEACTRLRYPCVRVQNVSVFEPNLVGTVATNHHSVSLVLKRKVDEERGEEETSSARAKLYGLDRSPSSAEIQGTGSQADDAPPLDVHCVCLGSQDGVMIVCGVCDTWQHGICYDVFPEQRHRLRGHVCLRCVKEPPGENGEKRSSLYPSMEKQKPHVLRKQALLKRTLLACRLARVTHLSARRLSTRLRIDEKEALDILAHMKKARLIAPCHCDKKTLKFRKTQSLSQDSECSQSQSQDDLNSFEEDDEIWDVDREALKLYLEKKQNEAAKRHQKRVLEESPVMAPTRKTKTPKRKISSRSQKRLKTDDSLTQESQQ